MLKHIEKEELVQILRQHYNLKNIKVITIDIGNKYNQQIDDSNRPLTLHLEVESAR